MTSEYNHKDFIHFRLLDKNSSNKDMSVALKNEIDYETIRNYSLDKIGRQAPYPLHDTDWTRISNYILKFWSPIIGSDAISTLLYLKMFSFGKDYTYVKKTELAKIMKKDVKTVSKYIDILEEFGFVSTFRRLYKLNGNKETSPYFKMRLTPPLLTEEQLLLLPEFLKEEHDELLEKYNDIVSTYDKVEQLSNREVLNDIVENGTPLATFERYIQNILESENMFEFIGKASDIDKAKNEEIHTILQGAISPPSYRTWFEPSMFYLEGNELKIITKSNYEKSWIEDKYINELTAWLSPSLGFESISVISFEEVVRAKVKKRR